MQYVFVIDINERSSDEIDHDMIADALGAGVETLVWMPKSIKKEIIASIDEVTVQKIYRVKPGSLASINTHTAEKIYP